MGWRPMSANFGVQEIGRLPPQHHLTPDARDGRWSRRFGVLGGLLAIGFAVALAAEQVLVKEMRHAAAPWLACREERRGLEDRGVDCWWRITDQGAVLGGTKELSKAWRRWRNSRRMCGGGVASCVVALVALDVIPQYNQLLSLGARPRARGS